MATPHDSLFRETFADPKHAGPLLRAMLPPAIRRLVRWRTLRPAAEFFREEGENGLFVDRLFTARIGKRLAFLLLLLEHKSRPDRWTALQMLAYIVAIWREIHRRSPARRYLPIVLPIVVSIGKRAWRTSTDIRSLLDLAPIPKAERATILAMVPQFRFQPLDLAACTSTELRRLGLSLLGLWTVAMQQFVAPHRGDDAKAAAAIAEWAVVARRLLTTSNGRDAIDTVFSYLLRVTKLGRRRLHAILEQHLGAKRMAKFVSTYQRITKTSEELGHRRGKAEGKAEGKVEGKAEGSAEVVLLLLRQRFGPLPRATELRVRRAKPRQLSRWARRLLTADRLTAVFADC
ncbi:MAG: Rpn family recombination-promoting nuclease/putative transposase [Planctomycetes bacterium]|nr:Rpn family recombination-promoting nuclease/putative transposase [Planctomycetota bacterium]